MDLTGDNVSTFAEDFLPDEGPLSIKEEEILEHPLAMPDCPKYCKQEPLEENEVGAFAEVLVPECCPLSIKEEEVLKDPLEIPDCSKYCKKEPEVKSEENDTENEILEDTSSSEYINNIKEEPELLLEDEAITTDVSSTEYAANTNGLSWIPGKDHSLLQTTRLHKLVHNELEMGLEKLTHVDTCGVGAQQTVSQEDNSHCSAANERLAEDKVSDFTCSSRQMSFSSGYSIIQNVIIHSEGVKPPLHIYRCCGNVYRTGVSLHNHLRMNQCGVVHAVKKLYNCDECGKLFSSASYLKIHGLIHSGVRPHNCDVCGKLFTRVNDLKDHALIHSGLKKNKCDICGKLFTRVRNLKAHASTHSGLKQQNLKQHKCDVCGKIFSTASNLRVHGLIHSGLRSHNCNVCGKLFARVHDLKTHMLIHSGVKPHTCGVCGKSFARIQNLNRHRLLHPEAKPHM